jgi:hypothetical protein
MPGERPSLWTTGALEPLTRALQARFPEAQFAYRESPDKLRAYLDVVTNADDDFAVLEIAAAPLVDLLLEQGVQVHVLPFRHPPTGLGDVVPELT